MDSKLDRHGPRPLWEQLLGDLRRRLDAGDFVDAFPGELQLSSDYDVSRHTVREALRRLRAEGAVTAGRGRTPRVAAAVEIEQPLGALYSMFAAVEQSGREQVSVVRSLDVRRDALVAERLGLEASVPLVYLERQRLADGEPLAVDRVWLPDELAHGLLEADFTRTSLYEELTLRCGLRLTGGQELLHAVVPTPAERRLLSVAEHVAAFAIERTGCIDGRPVEWRHSIVRGDRFAVSAQFSGRDGYRFDLAALKVGSTAAPTQR